MTQYWGAQDTFSYQIFIILKILGGGTLMRETHDKKVDAKQRNERSAS